MKEFHKNLDYQLYLQRESDFYHEPIKNEQFIYDAIKNGNIELIKENQLKYGNNPDNGKGMLSKDPLKNQIYHMIINTALVTRVCTGAGLPHETAFTLSDMYIRRADTAQSVREVMDLNDKMVLDFAAQMKKLCYSNALSPAVNKSINYILDHLNKKITTDELARQANLNRSYLSVLFKKEVGRSIQEYIQDKRVETAQNMLRNSSFSFSDIAYSLCYTSQSYFCKCFKGATGMTPKEYRDQNFIL